MDVIPQKELRNNIGAVLRRVEAGEVLGVTVSGRPVAELHPTGRRRWVSGPLLERIWSGTSPQSLENDLESIDGGVIDPFET